MYTCIHTSIYIYIFSRAGVGSRSAASWAAPPEAKKGFEAWVNPYAHTHINTELNEYMYMYCGITVSCELGSTA